MLAGELALAGIDVAIVERRDSQDLTGSRAGGLHARTIEVLDQRGIADRFLSQGQTHPVVHFHDVPSTSATSPPGTTTCSALWQNHIERILAEWVGELACTIYRGREVTGFAQDDDGVDVALVRRRGRCARHISSAATAAAVSFARRPASRFPGGIRRRAG